MKNKKVTIILFMMVSIFYIGTKFVYAASGYSFSVGTKFSNALNDDSTDEATIANSHLSSMGYSTKLLTQPTFSTFISKINNSRYWLESDVLYFLGHANSSTIYFDYMGQGGNYALALKNNNQQVCVQYWTNIGIGAYNMNKVKLGVFMGCSTASNSSSNLPKYANSQGAKVTIGWTTDIPQADTDEWTNYFFTKLKNGGTVSQAVNFANSKTYSNNSIKNTIIYGTSGTTINSAELPNFDEKSLEIKEYMVNKDIADRNINLSILNEINNLFDSKYLEDDFIIEVAHPDNYNIYDFYYNVDGVKTNIGYTVFVDNNNQKIIKIIDNMDNYAESIDSTRESIHQRLKSSLISEQKISEFRKNAVKQDIKNLETMPSKKIINEYMYFDVKNEKLYYNIDVEIVDPIINTKAIETYFNEIK